MKLTPGEAMMETLRSVNESDSNGEAANVVDGLFAIARAIHRLAKAVEEHPAKVQEAKLQTELDAANGDL